MTMQYIDGRNYLQWSQNTILYSILVDPCPHFISMLLDSNLIPLDVVRRWQSVIVLNTAKKKLGVTYVTSRTFQGMHLISERST